VHDEHPYPLRNHVRLHRAPLMSQERLVPAYLVRENSRIVVFACGDPLRGDDSVAPLACKALPPETLAKADVKLIGAMEVEYLRDLPKGVRAVIVDAVVGPPPGEIVEMDLFEIGQLLRDEPVIGRFVGVGIEAVAIGEEPTASVAESIPALRDAVAAAVQSLVEV